MSTQINQKIVVILDNIIFTINNYLRLHLNRHSALLYLIMPERPFNLYSLPPG